MKKNYKLQYLLAILPCFAIAAPTPAPTTAEAATTTDATTTTAATTTTTTTTSTTTAPAAQTPVMTMTPTAMKPPSDHNSEIRLGGFLISDIGIKLGLSTISGSRAGEIDFADVLGGDTTLNVFRADARWNFKGGHGLDFSWYDIDLQGHRTIDRTIDFGDQEFPINTNVDSRVRTNIYKVSYGYTFWREKPHSLTALIGAHITRIQTKLSAASINRESEFNATAPLPTIGLGWNARWTDKLTSRVVVQYFGVSLESKYSGHLVDSLAVVQYRLTRNFGLGTGYNRFDMNAEFEGRFLRLEFKHNYSGWLAYGFVEF
jgi:hypothetical protein